MGKFGANRVEGRPETGSTITGKGVASNTRIGDFIYPMSFILVALGDFIPASRHFTIRDLRCRILLGVRHFCAGALPSFSRPSAAFSSCTHTRPATHIKTHCQFPAPVRAAQPPSLLRNLSSKMSPRGTKRKAQAQAASSSASSAPQNPRARQPASPAPAPPAAPPTLDPLQQPHPLHEEASQHGIVLRKFYPPEMSNARARAYQAGELPRPIEQLDAALQATSQARESVPVKDAVVHWFKTDLRTADNHALFCAGRKAREAGVPLVTVYLVSPQDFEAHLVAPGRVDFVLRTLGILREDLAGLDIPLYVETVEERRQIPGRIAELMGAWGASHLYANMEYEVDELRREAKLVRMLADKGMCVEVMHDTCVVPPGRLRSGSGKQYAVYTPWFRSWIAHLEENPELLEPLEPPPRNPESARTVLGHLFNSDIPTTLRNKNLADEEAGRLRALWPAGEHEAKKRLEVFCEQRIEHYDKKRNLPAETGTSSLSVHLASGTLSARTAVRAARDRNRSRQLNAGSKGIQAWISEVAWRDFYRHVLVNWPYIWYVPYPLLLTRYAPRSSSFRRAAWSREWTPPPPGPPNPFCL